MTSLLHRSLEFIPRTYNPAARAPLYSTASLFAAIAPHVASGIIPGMMLSRHGQLSTSTQCWLVGYPDTWSFFDEEEAAREISYKHSLAGFACIAMSPTVAFVQRLQLKVPSALSIAELPHLCPMLQELILWLDAPYSAGCQHPDVVALVSRKKFPSREIALPSAEEAKSDPIGQQHQHREWQFLSQFGFLSVLELRLESSRARGLSEMGLCGVLTKMPQLRSLFICGNLAHGNVVLGDGLFSAAGGSNSTTCLPKLRDLDVRGLNHLSGVAKLLSAAASISNSSKVNNCLVRLSVDGHSSRAQPDELVAAISQLRALRDLYITQMALTDQHIAAIGAKCASLSSIRLQQCVDFTGEGFQRGWGGDDGDSSSAAFLRRLSLAQCQVNAAGLRAMGIGLQSSLSVLELASATVTAGDGISSAYSEMLEMLAPGLQQLRLAHPRDFMLSERAMTALFKYSKGLRRLEVVNGQFPDSGFRVLVDMCESPVEMLHIVGYGSIRPETVARLGENAAISMHLRSLKFGAGVVFAQSGAARSVIVDGDYVDDDATSGVDEGSNSKEDEPAPALFKGLLRLHKLEVLEVYDHLQELQQSVGSAQAFEQLMPCLRHLVVTPRPASTASWQ